MNSLTVVTSKGDLLVDLPIAGPIHDLASTCSAAETIEGVALCERLAETPVTLANLDASKELRDETHAAHKTIEDLRKAAKAPFISGGKAVDAICADLLDRLATVKAKLSAAIARTEAEAEAQRKEALAAACAAADEGRVDADAIARVNSVEGVESKWRWQHEVVDLKRLYAEAPEFCTLQVNALALQQVALATPKDREPRAIPGVIWTKVPFSRAGRVTK